MDRPAALYQHYYRRGVESVPSASCLRVSAEEVCLAMFLQVYHKTAERLMVGHALPYIQVVQLWVERHRALYGIHYIYRLS